MIYFVPKTIKLASEKISEDLGTFKTQYQVTFNEDLPLAVDMDSYFDEWNFYAEAGTQINITVIPEDTLRNCVSFSTEPPHPPSLISECGDDFGVLITGSAVIPNSGTWRLTINHIPEWGSGTYSVTIESDKPITDLTLLNDDRRV